MKFRPILFKPDMVKAIRNDRKRQTRRTINPQPIDNREVDGNFFMGDHSGYVKVDGHPNWREHFGDTYCPHGGIGDGLYVRESVQIVNKGLYVAIRYSDGEVRVWEHECPDYDEGATVKLDWSKVKKTPSIHVPKKYCRLFLELVSVRIEQLQDISKADAIAEGIDGKDEMMGWRDYLPRKGQGGNMFYLNAYNSYASLWRSINGPESWEANPWVWVEEFKVIDKPAGWPL